MVVAEELGLEYDDISGLRREKLSVGRRADLFHRFQAWAMKECANISEENDSRSGH